jgi:hypothetical protein
MVKSVYFLKPTCCGTHFAGLWAEQGFQPVTRATAFQAVGFTFPADKSIRANAGGKPGDKAEALATPICPGE